MTCRANDVDRFEYLRYLLSICPRRGPWVTSHPLPWNVKPILEERRKRTEASLCPAGAT